MVNDMKYFITEEQRKASDSTCYMEFMKGYYNDKCWLEDSINIDAFLWDNLDLSKLIHSVNKDFDYYDLTVITKEQWQEITRISNETSGKWKEVIDEATPWVEECFREFEVFTISGM